MTIIKTLISWPNGIVVGNLIASALWAVPAVLHHVAMRKAHRKIHARLDKLDGGGK